MTNPIRFIFALHNHQPIGNFGHIFEQTYRESYKPFLDVFEHYPKLKIALHTSGSLAEWLAEHHPEYLDRLAELVRQQRVEIIGGPFFEPILAMLPSRDRIGQIRLYSHWLEKRLGAKIRGLWIPERVWEQSYVRDLVEAGMHYTILDDCHFKTAGLEENRLTRHYLTEDDGRTMSVFPGSERLRYLLPYGTISEIIDYFARFAEQERQAVVVHGDDGEKFGSWPDTFDHVYHERWLHRFFDALSDNADWLITCTPSEVVDAIRPIDKIYIPDGSYREMGDWVMAPERQEELETIASEMSGHPGWHGLKKFVRGGFWRNFKRRYPETDEMYSRMMAVSTRLHNMINLGFGGAKIETAKELLYRGQCNCSYWHGAFGGVYLPHLRNAVYAELIRADNALDEAMEKETAWVESQAADFNFDGRNEVRLANEHLHLLVSPHQGGMMYELDVKSIAHNLLASLTRRPEAYHRKVIAGCGDQERFGSIHDRVVFKQAGLDRRIRYDAYPRKSLVDLFYDYETNIEAVRNGETAQHGDFVHGGYDALVRKKEGRIQVYLSREGKAYGKTVKIDKAITLSAGSSVLEIAYRLEGLPPGYKLHFATEWNFAGMPGGVENRYFHGPENASSPHSPRRRYGDLGTVLDRYDEKELALADDWLGIDITFSTSRPTNFYAFPIETVSQSEGGFELVHQSVAVQPHWYIEPDATGCWSIELRLAFDTSLARRRERDAHAFLRDAAKMLIAQEASALSK
ncbi:MAG TPA: alpha-amylase [Planctomycetaceae bacterium]|nr:alpha-amylase [Planctomycetaceae bacterium]